MGLFRYVQGADTMIVTPQQAAADEGFYFTAVNPTPGTGLATIAALASLVDTSPFVAIHAPVGGKSIILDYVRFTMTAIGTAAAGARAAVKLDTGGKAEPTGSTLGSPVNTKAIATAQAATAHVFAGPLVAAAAVTPKLVGHCQFRPVAPVVGDSYIIRFLDSSEQPLSNLAVAGTAIDDLCYDAPPVTIAPGCCAQIHLWFPSQTAASAVEVELGWIEYPQ